MRNKFKAYQDINDKTIKKIWKDPNTIFIIDTNILLNLYNYRPDTQVDFYKILEKLQNRIWIPYQVMLEYHRNRRKVIHEKCQLIENTCTNISDNIKNIFRQGETIASNIPKDFIKKYPELHTELELIEKQAIIDYQEKIKIFVEKIKTDTNNHISLNDEDTVYENLEKYIKSNIGKEHDEEFIKEIITNGEVRYSKKRPPGYKDESKSNGVYYHRNIEIPYKFGDLIIWEEIKRYIDEEGKNKKNIIFITDDNKDDWIQKNQQGKIAVARYELFDELLGNSKSETNKKNTLIDRFLISNSEFFVNKSDELFSLDLNENSVQDIKGTIVFTDEKDNVNLSFKHYNEIRSIWDKEIMSEDSPVAWWGPYSNHYSKISPQMKDRFTLELKLSTHWDIDLLIENMDKFAPESFVLMEKKLKEDMYIMARQIPLLGDESDRKRLLKQYIQELKSILTMIYKKTCQ